MQSFDQFIQDWTGRQPLYPPNPSKFRGECYQLFNFYNRDVVGAPDFLAPLAHQIYTEFENSPLAPYYDKIEYTSGATPQKGDVVVWSKELPGSDDAGHVEMCTMSGVIIFESFGCNWGGKSCHLTEHDYSYVLGWLRPKGKRMERETVNWLFRGMLNREPTEAELKEWVGGDSLLLSRLLATDKLNVAIRDKAVRYDENLKALGVSEKEVKRLRELTGEEGSAAQLKAALLAFLGLNK